MNDNIFWFYSSYDNSNYYYSDSNCTINHRLYGPAKERIDNNGILPNEWWYKGKYIPVSSQEQFEKYLKLIVFV